ncbi:MAG TPA: N-acetylmuramoyl-L-alanine amidase [Anaeromyxobacteraceae bacterium]|nr:N-acetylmuramoyl-L-alanine amidase [Anaeromyxobacteraceae bacterium]
MPGHRLAWVLALAALLAAAPGQAEGRAPPRSPAPRKAAPARPTSLERARAQLAAVKRDPAKRRYRHHWERAIRALEHAARGRDRGPALLEAARARYALYRFSAIEADRTQALRLAGRASAAGSRDAAGLAAAIRREMGDDDRPAPRRRQALARSAPRPPPAAAAPRGGGLPRSAPADEEGTDPELDRVVAEVLQPAEVTPEPVGSSTAGSAEGSGPARVSEVRTWSSADYTRVAVTLSRPVAFRETEIAPAGEQPRRLAVDLSPAELEGKAVARPVGDAKVERVRAAQHDAETVRVVLDLAGGQEYETFRLEDPPRVVVDVGTREADAPQRAPVADGGDEEGGAGPLRPVRRIVVDAGHGGHDPGAIGPGGVREKDVTLAMVHRLRRKLERAGFQVVLTRRDDRFLSLDERTALANTARGDLFVSLHANAHPRRDRTGVETYFLNVTDDRYAARLAARENGLVHLAGAGAPQVTRILSDLDATRSAGPSRRLAALVQKELVSRVRANVGEVRDLGVKHALFYVLLGARMPAVLVETAFVSNRKEERRLASPRYQEEVAEAVARAVTTFAGRDASRVAARSLRPGEPALYP